MENLRLKSQAYLRSVIDNHFFFHYPNKTDLKHAAYILVLELTKEQHDRDEPYINHVFRVTVRCIQFGVANSNVIIAAILHDTVEDHAKKLSDKLDNLLPEGSEAQYRERAYRYIEREFGTEVRKYLEDLTNPITEGIPEKVERQRLYQEHVHTLLRSDSPVRIIKLADFFDNGVLLPQLQDEKKRMNLSKRYSPVFRYFIDTVERIPTELLKRELLPEVLGELYYADEETRKFLFVRS